MKLIIAKNYEEMSSIAVNILMGLMYQDKRVNLSITAGNTPKEIYRQMTELVKGKTVQEAMQVTNQAVCEALDGLPPVKVHCSLLAEEAIHAALWDYANKNGLEIQGLKKPKSDIGEEEVEEEY